MSTMADRSNIRANADFPYRATLHPDTYFWIGLTTVTAAMIACAFVGAHLTAEMPPEVLFVWP